MKKTIGKRIITTERKSRSKGLRKHCNVVMSSNHPVANRSTLLHQRCDKCRKKYMGAVFQTVCDRPECVDAKPSELKGEKRGSLLVVQPAGNGFFWRCRCDCGRIVVKSESYLDGAYPTCGACQTEARA